MNLNRPHSSTLNRFANVRSYSSLSNYQQEKQLDNEVANINFSKSYSSFQQQHDRLNNLFSHLPPSNSNNQQQQHHNSGASNSNNNSQPLPISSLSSAQQYNNYSVHSGHQRPMTASSFGNYNPSNLYSNHNNSNNNTNNNYYNNNGTSGENVQYGPNLGRRKSISNLNGLNIRRSQTPQPSSGTPSVIYQPATFHLYPPQQQQQQPTVSITNIPSHSKAMEMLVKPLPLSITPIVENVVVRVPTARRKVKKEKSTSSPKSSPKSVSSSPNNTSVEMQGRQTFQPTPVQQSPPSVTIQPSSTNNRPSSSSVNRKYVDRPLKPFSSHRDILMNRPRSSTPTLKKSTSLNKIPPRDHLHRSLTKSPSTPSLIGNSSTISMKNGKKKSSSQQAGTPNSDNTNQKVNKKEPVPSTTKVPRLLKSIAEMKAQQAKIEILTLEDYMLDSPSRTITKVYEEIPPPKHKLLSILMDINIRYNTSVTSANHPNYEFYTTDRDVYSTLRERQAFIVETRYGKMLSPIDECGIQFEGAYFGRYSFVFNIDTNFFGYHSWTLILRVYLDSESTTLCVFGEKYCWFTIDINNIKMNNQEFQRTIGGMKLDDWNEIFISVNMLQQFTKNPTNSEGLSSSPSSSSPSSSSPSSSTSGRQILVWANGINTVIPIDSETKFKVKPGENKSLNFVNMLNGRAFRGSLSSIVLLNKASESMDDLIRSGKSFLKNHQKPSEKPNLVKLTQSPNNAQEQQQLRDFQKLQEDEEELVFA